jgi:hypothetical protein
MNPWIAKAVILAASITMVVIRAPHGRRSRGVKVVKDRKGRRELILVALAMLGFLIPLAWVTSPAFSFAEYPLRLDALIAGVVCFVVGLWLWRRGEDDAPGVRGRVCDIRHQVEATCPTRLLTPGRAGFGDSPRIGGRR